MGPVKSRSNNRLALLSEVSYIILQIRTTESGSIKHNKLLTGEQLTEIYCNGFLVYPGHCVVCEKNRKTMRVEEKDK